MSLRPVSGYWHFRFWKGREYTGNTGHKATEANRAKAEAKEAKMRALVEIGQGDSLRIKQKLFADAVEEWLTWAEGEHRDKPETARRLRSAANVLKPFMGRVYVSAITAGRIEDYKTWRRTPRRDAEGNEILPVKEITIRHDLAALSVFFRYARKQRWLTGNPLEDVDMPSDKDAVRIHPLSAAEEQAYLSIALKHRRFDLHDVASIMLNQGNRPEELLELRWDAVNLETGVYKVANGKTPAARRTLRMTQTTREILTGRAQNAKGSPWVFPSPMRPGCHLRGLQRPHEETIAQVKKDLGSAFVLYDCRHTFATRAAESGMPLATLASIMGHSSLRMIAKYVHIRQDEMNEQMDRYDANRRATPPADPVIPSTTGRVQ